MLKKVDLSFMYGGLKGKVLPDKELPEKYSTGTVTDGSIVKKESRGNLLYWAVYRFWLWKIYNPIKMFPREIKWFIQRGKKGYSDKDLWDFDVYLAYVIRDGLRTLSDNAHGYPSDYKTIKQWKKKLNSTADSFDVWLKYFNMEDVPNTPETKTKRYWTNRTKKIEKNQVKMHNFIDDLGKYWD